MRYCRIQTQRGARYADVAEVDGEPWLLRLRPPFEEDCSYSTDGEPFDPRPLAKTALLPPVRPSKIVCIGRNYRDHAQELGNPVPLEPLVFLKPPSSLAAPGDPIRIPSLSARVDFEGELGVVIGSTCARISGNEAASRYIRGFTILNDVTARDLQKKDGQWSRAKGFDTFCPVGPIVTDEINPELGLSITTRLNSELRQDGNTRDLIFSIDDLVRYISAVMTLNPGDLIATGTPAGVGPMHAGDRVEVSIEGIGSLSNPVIAAG